MTHPLTTANEYAAWCGRLATDLGLLVEATASPTLFEIRANNAKETLHQYQEWKDARPGDERGFVHLPGLAST